MERPSPVARKVTPWPLVEPLLSELKPGDVLLQRGHYLQAVTFYSKRLTPITNLGWSELNFGAERAKGRNLFLSPQEFADRWNGRGRVLAVVHRDWVVSFGPEATPRLTPPLILAGTPNGKHFLFANRP